MMARRYVHVMPTELELPPHARLPIFFSAVAAGPPAVGPEYVSRTFNGDGNLLTFVFSEAVTLVTPPTVSGGFVLSGHSGDGTATHTWAVVPTVPQGATVTADADAGAFVDLNDALGTAALTGASVTNDSVQTAPGQTGAGTDGSGSVVTVNFDAAVTSPGAGWGGFTLSINGGAGSAISQTGGAGTTAVVFSASPAGVYGDTLTLAYTPGDVIGPTGVKLAAFSGRSVTNNVPPPPPPPPPAPVADFTGTPTGGTASLSVAFTDTSTGTPTSWLWEKNLNGAGWVNFDGTPTAQHPTEIFAAGTSSVRETATNAGGSDTKTRTDYITATVPFSTVRLDFGGGPTQSGTTAFAPALYAEPPDYGWEVTASTDFDRGAAAATANPDFFRDASGWAANTERVWKIKVAAGDTIDVRFYFYDPSNFCNGNLTVRDADDHANTVTSVTHNPGGPTSVRIRLVDANADGFVRVGIASTGYGSINGVDMAAAGSLPPAFDPPPAIGSLPYRLDFGTLSSVVNSGAVKVSTGWNPEYGAGVTHWSESIGWVDLGSATASNPNFFRAGFGGYSPFGNNCIKVGNLTPGASHSIRAYFYSDGNYNGTYTFRDKNNTGNTASVAVTTATPTSVTITTPAASDGTIEVEMFSTGGSGYYLLCGLDVATAGNLQTALS